MIRRAFVPLILHCLVTVPAMAADSYPNKPKTRQAPVKETLHGVTLTDPYRWLEDQQSAETRAWIAEQNRFTRTLLDPAPGREAIRKRMSELLRVETVLIPMERGGRYFYRRRPAGAEQPLILMRESLNGKDKTLVDPATLSADHTASARISAVSDDGKLLAYAIQQGGKDEIAVRFLDVDSGRHLDDALPEGKWTDVSLTPDKKRFYYASLGGPNPRIRVPVMGTPFSADKEIFGDQYGAEHIVFGEVSENGHWLLITVFHGSAGDVIDLFAQDLRTAGPIVPVVKGVRASFLGTVVDDTLIVDTNWNAPRRRVLSVDLPALFARKAEEGPLPPEQWKEIVPESKTATIDGISLAGGRLFVRYLENVQSRIRVYSASGNYEREIELPAIGSASAIYGRWKSNEAFYNFTSFHIPSRIYRLDAAKGVSEMWFQQPVPIESGDFVLDQQWFQSKDGTRIPLFLLYKKGLQRDGNRPVLMTGYGGFNVSMTPAFSATAVAWAELGGVFALPNLRGGSEFGEQWHENGMRFEKQNVFDDFIGAAEYLIREKYTNPKRLAITGRSNGGLLVGAALTQRPDLFQAVVCGYPLLDMIRYQKFLVARFWVPEYGSSDDPAQFKYLLSYSPYHHVKPGTDYPAVLFITGDADTRVDPLHARKMTALLQRDTAWRRPVALLYDVKAGHSGGQSATQTIDEITDTLSFLTTQMGIRP
ncbi:MAG: prolyl oligopeptidase family serine peptidase [Bryobacteraceae bacterium]